jgi:hypothetical protein
VPRSTIMSAQTLGSLLLVACYRYASIACMFTQRIPCEHVLTECTRRNRDASRQKARNMQGQ